MRFTTWFSAKNYGHLQNIGLTVAACIGTTWLATPLLGYLDLANIVMLFLLNVLVVAVKLGRHPAILASVLSVLCFDFFFVPPRFSLAVSNIQYLITFLAMLVTALLTTHLMSVLAQKAQEALKREQQTQALYGLAKQLAGALAITQVKETVESFVKSQLLASALVLVVDDASGALHPIDTSEPETFDAHQAANAYERGTLLRHVDGASGGGEVWYLPIQTSVRPRGVLVVRLGASTSAETEASRPLLDALASLLAVALERLHYAQVAQDAEVQMLTERLRNSILSALSHDLRTPLTAMVGLADALFLIKPVLPEQALESAQALHEQGERLASMVDKLLDMARLNAGGVTLRREWQPLDEVVGTSIQLLRNALSKRFIDVRLDQDLPLLEFDAVLMERVLCNLLENAAKYSPPDTPIVLQAKTLGDWVEVSVIDQGPGFAEHQHDDLFKMFVRGHSEPGSSGMGMGLAICKTIVQAHGGTIDASSRSQGGGCVRFTLPKGNPPTIDDEAA